MRNKWRIDKRGVHQYLGCHDKSVAVRIPTMIYDIVMNYDGKTFTDKLINLIFDYNEFHDLKK